MGKILVLGVGNLLMGDEGIGVHVSRELMGMDLPKNVEVIDGGTAAFDLIYYLKGIQKLIVVDAVQAGEEVGSIYRLRPEDLSQKSPNSLSLHQITLQEVLKAARRLGMKPETVIIGIEPKQIRCTDKLSPELKEAIPTLISLVKGEFGAL